MSPSTMNSRLAIVSLLLATSCDKLLSAEVQVRSICLTEPQQQGSAGTGSLSYQYDIGNKISLSDLEKNGIALDLRLSTVDVLLARDSSTSFATIEGVSVYIITADPANPKVLVTGYQSSGGDPTEIHLTGTPDLDILQYLQSGKLGVEVDVLGTTPPAPWTATGTACFHLDVGVDYLKAAGNIGSGKTPGQ
jgi:hypothetical protein